MQTSNLPTEKVDAETAPRSIKDTDILQPLQFLIAARRGVQMDPSFSAINIPEDRYITYNGDSGLESQSSRTPFWIRCVIALGYMHNVSKIGLVFVVFAEAMNISRDTMRDSPKELKRKPLLQDVLWSSYWTVGAILLLFLSRMYAKRHMAKRIPPHLDPLSYQSQFKSALDEQGWQYREIVGRSLKDMEKIWSKDRSQVERFRVEGLMDPASDRAYDVVVILRKEGKVQMSFRAPEEGPASWSKGIIPLLNVVVNLAVLYYIPTLFPFLIIAQKPLTEILWTKA